MEHIATIKPLDVTNGPGVRVSVFVSGCTHYCKGCFNQAAFDFNYGREFNDEVKNEIRKHMSNDIVKGMSILGGDPLHMNNTLMTVALIQIAKEVEKPVWVWTGYMLEELKDRNDVYTDYILDNIETLIDGRYEEDKRDLSLQYRGSSNQRVIKMN